MGQSSAGRRHRGLAADGDRSHRRQPAEKLPAGDRPLHGIRVLDLTRVLAGRPARARSPSTAPT